MRFLAYLLVVSGLSGCGDNGVPTGEDAATGGDASAPPDLSMSGGCSPKCSGLAPFCNATNRCVACLKDTDCAMGSYCRVVSDAIATCTPGCTSDDRCGNGQKCCDMRCVDLQTDVKNCGGCGMPCTAVHSAASCVAGQCMAGKCDSGWGDCNNDGKDGCETNLHADVAHCTACGMACNIPNAFAGCADGCYAAACKFGFDDCNLNAMDGCETSVLSDKNNCGGCGKPCLNLPNASATCTNGSCLLGQCNAGFANCDGNPMNGCEVTIATDGNNCGGCGNVCPMGTVCKQGGCTCPNCNIPNASALCVNNQCVFDKCNPGFFDCNNNKGDGCEINLQSDPKNCGQCGNVCPVNNPGCASGVCVPCGNDCWGQNGCLTQGGKCIVFTCRAGNAGPNFCNGCRGWREISWDQWINAGYCADVIAKYRQVEMTNTHCGQAPGCCASTQACVGGDNAWHFWDGQATHVGGPSLGTPNNVNCKNWDFTDNSAYTRITACER